MQIRGKLAELMFKRGDMEGAAGRFEQALQVTGTSIPRRPHVVLFMLLWEAAVQVAHTLLPWLFVHRLKRVPSSTEVQSLRLYSGLAHGAWYARTRMFALWAHLRGLNLAERFAPSLELALVYAEHAPAMSLIPLFGRAVKYAEKSLKIRTALNDQWGQGQSLHYHGIVLYAASRFTECIEKCQKAIRILERTGDYWQVHIARYQIAASHYHLGDFDAAVREAQLNHRSGTELGDELASGIILDVWSRATGGDCPQDLNSTRAGPDTARSAVQDTGAVRGSRSIAGQRRRVVRRGNVQEGHLDGRDGRCQKRVHPALPYVAGNRFARAGREADQLAANAATATASGGRQGGPSSSAGRAYLCQ